MATNGFFYQRMYYYKLKHEVFRELGYVCHLCGNDDPLDLQIHHEDDHVHNGKGGTQRYCEARQMIRDGQKHKLKLFCEDCHDAWHRSETPIEALESVLAKAHGLTYNGFSGAIEDTSRVRV